MTNKKFLELFQTHVSVLEQYGGEVAKDPGAIHPELDLEGIDPDLAMEAQKKTAIKTATYKYLAVAMLEAAAVTIYRKLKEDLENQYTMGDNNYPSIIASAYNLIVNYKGSRKNG
jgi:lipid II:glycine glycyltransferase (peptidoglycan interpeptide bridge formation enzyme)